MEQQTLHGASAVPAAGLAGEEGGWGVLGLHRGVLCQILRNKIGHFNEINI